ncbi:hypothetical protein QCA50_000851 [Cerrena zonata]|uniref:Uncharacterized protein n=1 Tax=Cerrena zonata TaxID=2478898 RepID=A0AAW0GYN3_9APHY
MRRNYSFASTTSDVSAISSAPSWPDVSLFVSPPPPSRSPSPILSVQGSTHSDTSQSEQGSNVTAMSARTRTSNSPMQQRREDNIKDELRVNGRRVNPLFTPTTFPAPSGPPVIRRHPIQHHDSITSAPSGSSPQLAGSDSSSELEDNSITPRGSVSDVATEIASQASSASIGTVSSAYTGSVSEQDTVGRMDPVERIGSIYRANTKDSLSVVQRIVAHGGAADRFRIAKRNTSRKWLVVTGERYGLEWLTRQETLLRRTIVEEEAKIRELERELAVTKRDLRYEEEDLDAQIRVVHDLREELADAKQRIDQINRIPGNVTPQRFERQIRDEVHDEWTEWADNLEDRLKRSRARLAQAQKELAERDKMFLPQYRALISLAVIFVIWFIFF